MGDAGFGICGIPENLLKHLASTRLRDLTVVSCTGGMEDAGVGLLIKAGLVKRLISSYIGENKVIFDKFLNGQLEVELVPQVNAVAVLMSDFFTCEQTGDRKSSTEFNTHVQTLRVCI